MSEKLLIEFEVKKEIAKKVSLETGKFYYQSGTFEKNFSEFSKEAKEYMYDEIFCDGNVHILRLDRLQFFYETIEKEPVKFEKFNFTSKFFEGEQINEFVLHYFEMQKKYLNIKATPTKTVRRQVLHISYLLHPSYVEAKKIIGEEVLPKQMITVSRENISEALFLRLAKYLEWENDNIYLNLTKFETNDDSLFASSILNVYGTEAKSFLYAWVSFLEKRESKGDTSDEKQAWINQFGSSHLKRAHSMNYNCQRQYVTERAAKEHPDFILDFNIESKRKGRPFPSEKALDAEELLRKENPTINVRVEWMLKPEKECEVVVIHDYLGKYLMYKKI